MSIARMWLFRKESRSVDCSNVFVSLLLAHKRIRFSRTDVEKVSLLLSLCEGKIRRLLV